MVSLGPDNLTFLTNSGESTLKVEATLLGTTNISPYLFGTFESMRTCELPVNGGICFFSRKGYLQTKTPKKRGEEIPLQNISLYISDVWKINIAAHIALKARTFLSIKLWPTVLSLSCLMYTVQWAIGKLLTSNTKHGYPTWSFLNRSNSKTTCGTICITL